jgi:hypothetical protein
MTAVTESSSDGGNLAFSSFSKSLLIAFTASSVLQRAFPLSLLAEPS